MDGMRARRLKCGSPLGRIIDEAHDQVAYASAGLALGFLLRIDSPKWMLSISMVNVPFYSMEIRHIICKKLNINIGEVGPVEVELIISLIFAFSGGVYGSDIYDK